MKRTCLRSLFFVVALSLVLFLGMSVFGAMAEVFPGGWRNPLGPEGGDISIISGGSFNNDNYYSKYKQAHGGVDMYYHTGSERTKEPVYAIADGTIDYVRRVSDSTYNDSVIHVIHVAADGTSFKATYGHTYALSGLKKGDTVTRGQQIGNTTHYNSYHLHFAIVWNRQKTPSGWGGLKSDLLGSSTSTQARLEMLHTYGWWEPFEFLAAHPSSYSYEPNWVYYEVLWDSGLKMRASASTSATTIEVMSKGTIFKADLNRTATANGYTWAYSQMEDGTSGWVAISNPEYCKEVTENTWTLDYYIKSAFMCTQKTLKKEPYADAEDVREMSGNESVVTVAAYRNKYGNLWYDTINGGFVNENNITKTGSVADCYCDEFIWQNAEIGRGYLYRFDGEFSSSSDSIKYLQFSIKSKDSGNDIDMAMELPLNIIELNTPVDLSALNDILYADGYNYLDELPVGGYECVLKVYNYENDCIKSVYVDFSIVDTSPNYPTRVWFKDYATEAEITSMEIFDIESGGTGFAVKFDSEPSNISWPHWDVVCDDESVARVEYNPDNNPDEIVIYGLKEGETVVTITSVAPSEYKVGASLNVVVIKCGHEYTSVGCIYPCKDGEKWWESCNTCGEIINSGVGPIAAHEFDSWYITVKPTATSSGRKERSCTVCGFTETCEITQSDCIHQRYCDEEICLNCDAAYTGGNVIHLNRECMGDDAGHWYECNDCGEVTEKKEHIRVCDDDSCMECDLPYNGENLYHINPEMMSDDVYHWGYCPDCGATLEKAMHERYCSSESRYCIHCYMSYTGNEVRHIGPEIKDAAVEATCTASGKTEGSHCSFCNGVIVAQNVIPATGHDSGKWVVVTEATTTQTGLKELRCTKCNYVLNSESIPKIESGNDDIPDPVVQTVNAKKGDTVTLNVYVNTKDAIAARVQVSYDDSVFEFVSSACEGGQSNNGLYMLYSLTDVINGRIGTITLKVKDTASDGVYMISVSEMSASDINENLTGCKAAVDKVKIASRLPGDANEDGIVDIRDIVRLAKYLGGYDVAINESNSNVNGDSVIDIRDIVRFAKYLGGYDVKLQ